MLNSVHIQIVILSKKFLFVFDVLDDLKKILARLDTSRGGLIMKDTFATNVKLMGLAELAVKVMIKYLLLPPLISRASLLIYFRPSQANS